MSTTASGQTITTDRPAAVHHLARVVAWIAVVAVVTVAATFALLTHRSAVSDTRPSPAQISAPARHSDAGQRLQQINGSRDESVAQPPSGHLLRSY